MIETVQKLTSTDERGQVRIDPQCAKDVARMVGVHSCCASSDAATKDGIGKRLILLPKPEAASCCSIFPPAVVGSQQKVDELKGTACLLCEELILRDYCICDLRSTDLFKLIIKLPHSLS